MHYLKKALVGILWKIGDLEERVLSILLYIVLNQFPFHSVFFSKSWPSSWTFSYSNGIWRCCTDSLRISRYVVQRDFLCFVIIIFTCPTARARTLAFSHLDILMVAGRCVSWAELGDLIQKPLLPLPNNFLCLAPRMQLAWTTHPFKNRYLLFIKQVLSCASPKMELNTLRFS